MRTQRLLMALGVLAAGALACTLNLPLPNVQINPAETGPTQTETISVPAPDSSPASLTIKFAAGELNIGPGAGGTLVQGTATYNVDKLKPAVTQTTSGITLSSPDISNESVPLNLNSKVVNTWDLELGDQPMDLTISAGAYHAKMDFGGLSLTGLDVHDGASHVEMAFAQPNLASMDQFSYTTGASSVQLTGLANAHFSQMTFNGGAGDYTLDFTGDLTSDAEVTIKAGVCQVTLLIPDGIPVVFDVSGGLTNVDMQGSFRGGGSAFNQSASGPSLTIHADLGAGSLILKNP